jgi:hypothetical protein
MWWPGERLTERIASTGSKTISPTRSAPGGGSTKQSAQGHGLLAVHMPIAGLTRVSLL